MFALDEGLKNFETPSPHSLTSYRVTSRGLASFICWLRMNEGGRLNVRIMVASYVEVTSPGVEYCLGLVGDAYLEAAAAVEHYAGYDYIEDWVFLVCGCVD